MTDPQAVYYEGAGRGSHSAPARSGRPGAARCDSTSRFAVSAGPTSTSRTARWTTACARRRSSATRCRGSSPSSGHGVRGVAVGDAVVVRPLDSPRRDGRRQGCQSHLSRAEVPRDRHAGRVPALVDGAGVHLPQAPRRHWISGSPRSSSRWRSRATTCGSATSSRVTRWSSSAAGRSACWSGWSRRRGAPACS